MIADYASRRPTSSDYQGHPRPLLPAPPPSLPAAAEVRGGSSWPHDPLTQQRPPALTAHCHRFSRPPAAASTHLGQPGGRRPPAPRTADGARAAEAGEGGPRPGRGRCTRRGGCAPLRAAPPLPRGSRAEEGRPLPPRRKTEAARARDHHHSPAPRLHCRYGQLHQAGGHAPAVCLPLPPEPNGSVGVRARLPRTHRPAAAAAATAAPHPLPRPTAARSAPGNPRPSLPPSPARPPPLRRQSRWPVPPSLGTGDRGHPANSRLSPQYASRALGQSGEEGEAGHPVPERAAAERGAARGEEGGGGRAEASSRLTDASEIPPIVPKNKVCF